MKCGFHIRPTKFAREYYGLELTLWQRFLLAIMWKRKRKPIPRGTRLFTIEIDGRNYRL